MSHQRQAIRDALKTMLVAADTIAGSRVYVNRNEPLLQRPDPRSDASVLPAILIYTRNETSQILNVSPREYLRTVEVVIELAVAVLETDGAVDNVLDDFARAVELVILRDDTVTNTAADFRLVSSSMALVDDAEMPLGAVQLTCEADYVECHPIEDLQDDIDDLREVRSEFEVRGVGTEG